MDNIIMSKLLKCVVVVISLVFSATTMANNLDQLIKVKFDDSGCVKKTKLLSANNCLGPSNPCQGQEECVCSAKNSKIKWKGKVDKPFEIIFEDADGTPFDANCKYNSKKDNSKQVVKCKVKDRDSKGSYKYSIAVENCPIYDPRIVVR